MPGLSLFTSDGNGDFATAVWVVVLVAWGLATVKNFVSGTWVLADIPAGLAAVLVALPISKGVAVGLRHLGKG